MANSVKHSVAESVSAFPKTVDFVQEERVELDYPLSFLGAAPEYQPLQIELLGGVVTGGAKGNFRHVLSKTACILVQSAVVEDLGYTVGGLAGMGRYGHAVAYDQRRGVFVLFGGKFYNKIAETWEWDGTKWMNRRDLAPCPTGRSGHQMSFDVRRGVVLLFGGWSVDGLSDETWTWDGTQWRQLELTPRPSARMGHTLLYDTRLDVTLLFGGLVASGEISDEVWEWSDTWRMVSGKEHVLRNGDA